MPASPRPRRPDGVRRVAVPKRFRWALHNLVGHPLLEVLTQLGAPRLGEWVHDVTLPRRGA